MDKLILVLGSSLVCFFSSVALGLTCTEMSKELAYADANNITHDLDLLKSSLNGLQKTIITEQDFTWNATKPNQFSIVVRDGETISSKGKIPPEFGKNKLPAFTRVVKVLGKPENGPVKKLIKYTWACQDTPSIISVFAEESGKLIHYSGQYCPTPHFKMDCTSF